MLGMPQVPERHDTTENGGPVRFTEGHHFSLAPDVSVQVMAGVRAFLDHGVPISLSAVVYRSTLHALPFTYQISDVVGAGKLKLILPLLKGNALDLEEHEFISLDEAGQTFERLSELRAI